MRKRLDIISASEMNFNRREITQQPAYFS